MNTKQEVISTDDTQSKLSKRWLNIIGVYGGSILIGVTLVSVPANSIFLKSLHGFTNQEYGAVFIGQLLFSILGALLAGPAVIRVSLKSMYSISLIFLFLSQMCLMLSSFYDSETALWLIRLSLSFFGFGFGFGGGPINGLIPLMFPKSVHSALTALHMAGGIGLLSTPLYFQFITHYFDWWIGSAILGSAIAIILLIVIFSLKKDQPQIDKTNEERRLPLRVGYFWLMIFIAFLYAVIESMFSTWAIIFVKEVKGFSSVTATVALSTFYAGLTLGRLLVSLIVSKVEPLLIWITLPFMLVFALWWLPHIDSVQQSFFAFGFAGFSCSAFVPLMISISSIPYPHAMSWIGSMLTASIMCGVGIGAFVIGKLVSHLEMTSLYHYAIPLPILLFILIWLANKHKPNTNAVTY